MFESTLWMISLNALFLAPAGLLIAVAAGVVLRLMASLSGPAAKSR